MGSEPPEGGGGRSRFGRTLVVLAVVGVLAVGTVLGTATLGSEDDGDGGVAPPTNTVPTRVDPRDVDATLVERAPGQCPGDPGSRCDYGFYLRGDRTTAEQRDAIEDALGPAYDLEREIARLAVGDRRLRGGRGYVYRGPDGRTVTSYLRRNRAAQRCNRNPALACVDVVAFEL